MPPCQVLRVGNLIQASCHVSGLAEDLGLTVCLVVEPAYAQSDAAGIIAEPLRCSPKTISALLPVRQGFHRYACMAIAELDVHSGKLARGLRAQRAYKSSNSTPWNSQNSGPWSIGTEFVAQSRFSAFRYIAVEGFTTEETRDWVKQYMNLASGDARFNHISRMKLNSLPSANSGGCILWNRPDKLRSETTNFPLCPEISHANALKCLQGKSLAFIGDSQMRDLAFAMALWLKEGATIDRTVRADRMFGHHQGNVWTPKMDTTKGMFGHHQGNGSVHSSIFNINSETKASKTHPYLRTSSHTFEVVSWPYNFQAEATRVNRHGILDWNIDMYGMAKPKWDSIRHIVRGLGLNQYAFVFANFGLHDAQWVSGTGSVGCELGHSCGKWLQAEPDEHIDRHVRGILEFSNTTIWLPMNQGCKLEFLNVGH